MIVKINDKEKSLDVGDVATLGEILEGIAKNDFKEKEFITDISINGEAIPEEKRDALNRRSASDITLIEIKTENLPELSVRTLEGMEEFLDGLAEAINESADKFRIDDETEANRHFVSCVDGLQIFIGVIDKIRSLNGLDFKTIQCASASVAEKEAALLKVLNTLHNKQVNKDWITLADVLEYELLPIISAWRKILPVLCSAVQQKEA